MEKLIFELSLWQKPQGSIRINLSWTGDEGYAVLACAELMGEKIPLWAFLVYNSHSVEQSQHIDLSPTDYIQRHQSVWNVERENMLLFALYSMWLH